MEDSRIDKTGKEKAEMVKLKIWWSNLKLKLTGKHIIIPKENSHWYSIINIPIRGYSKQRWCILTPRSDLVSKVDQGKGYFRYSCLHILDTIRSRKLDDPWYAGGSKYYEITLDDKNRIALCWDIHEVSGGAYEIEYNQIFRYIKNVEVEDKKEEIQNNT